MFSLLIFASPPARATEAPIPDNAAAILAVTPRTNLPPDLLDSTQAIYLSADRAARLTRQLLMFSRKNVMKPEPLDLRKVVSGSTSIPQNKWCMTVLPTIVKRPFIV